MPDIFEEEDQQCDTLAAKFVKKTFTARYATVFIGFTLSIVLISLGYNLTQQDIEQKTVLKNKDTEISMDFKETKFALKNTAPGLVLIICGTFIAINTINKTTWVKTQWSDNKNAIPGYTESKG